MRVMREKTKELTCQALTRVGTRCRFEIVYVSVGRAGKGKIDLLCQQHGKDGAPTVPTVDEVVDYRALSTGVLIALYQVERERAPLLDTTEEREACRERLRRLADQLRVRADDDEVIAPCKIMTFCPVAWEYIKGACESVEERSMQLLLDAALGRQCRHLSEATGRNVDVEAVGDAIVEACKELLSDQKHRLGFRPYQHSQN